jgi:IS5 family transposase
LCHRALEKLVDLAKRNDVKLRQSYRRVAKRAAIMVGRYTHAHQFKRARRALKFLRIRLGRVIRDIRRKIAGEEALKERFADLLALAHRVRFQDHRQRGHKVYALHAPEVECIGKGKARGALRVWLQGVDHHPGHQTQGRPVRVARQGAARQPV